MLNDLTTHQEPTSSQASITADRPVAFYSTPAGARQDLEELISVFLSEATAAEDISVIDELFFVWLKTSYRETTKDYGINVTFNILRITTFLMELQEKWQNVKTREAQDAGPEKGGMKHE